MEKHPLSKSGNEEQEWDALDLDLNSTAPMTPTGPKTGKTSKGQPAPTPAPRKVVVQSRPNCEKMAHRIPGAYQQLLAKKHPSLRLPDIAYAQRVAAITPETCSNDSTVQDATKLLIDTVTFYTPRVAILLPLSGPLGEQGKAVLDGIKSSLAASGGLRPDQVFIRDTSGKDTFLEHWLAEAVLVGRVGMVIGGLSTSEETILRSYANRLYLPTLLLAPPRREAQLSSPYVFNVFPSEIAMSDALVSRGVARGMTRLGALVPTGRGDTDFVQSFLEAARQRNVTVAGPIFYEPGNYDSMERAGAQLFKTNREQRGRDYQDAVRKAKEKAAADGKPFDQRFVILKPQVDVDGVFIPDNFKTVRYFAKIFKYLGVERMTLLGNQEWRATPIIQPWEPYLEGSMFVDYIGYYNELPPMFRSFAGESRKFLNGSNAATFDFRSIGLQALQIAKAALRLPPQRRYQLVNTLRLLGSTAEDITRGPGLFDRFNRFAWPAYVFDITGKDIVIRR